MKSHPKISRLALLVGAGLLVGFLSGCSTASVVTKANALPPSLQGRTFVVYSYSGAERYVQTVSDDFVKRGMVAAPVGGRPADYEVLLFCEFGKKVATHDLDFGPATQIVHGPIGREVILDLPQFDTTVADFKSYFRLAILDISRNPPVEVYDGHIGYMVELDEGVVLGASPMNQLVSAYLKNFPGTVGEKSTARIWTIQ